MLDYAMKYTKELNEIYLKKVIGRDKYKYWNFSCFWETKFELVDENSEWLELNRVSLDKEGNILGFLSGKINRPENFIRNLSILSLTSGNGFILMTDLFKFIDELFLYYKYYKIKVFMIKQNPIREKFERFLKKLGGRIIGEAKKEIRLVDGLIYDSMNYELFIEDYIKNIKKIKRA